MSETWTDDDGVTHDMCSVIARCFVDVKSRITPPKNGEGVVTCLACLGTSELDKVLQAMVTHGVVVQEQRLKEMEQLWQLEKIPMGPRGS